MERVTPARGRALGVVGWVVASVAGRVTHSGERPRVFTTLARHRRLFRYWLPFAGGLLLRGDLPRADAELVVLRTAWNCSSAYEWTQHVSLATRRGLGPAVAAAVPRWREAHVFSDRQRLLLAAVDELHDHRVLTDATWSKLAPELPVPQLIELCMLVGHYEMLAMTLNSLGVEPEPAAHAALDAASAEIALELGRARNCLVADSGQGVLRP